MGNPYDRNDPWYSDPANGYVWNEENGVYVPNIQAAGNELGNAASTEIPATPDARGNPYDQNNSNYADDPNFVWDGGAWRQKGLSDYAEEGLGYIKSAAEVAAEMVNPEIREPTSFYDATAGMESWDDFAEGRGLRGMGAPGDVALDNTQAGSRNWQDELLQELQAQASGNLNSRAQQSLRESVVGAQAQQRALGSTMRGTGGGAGLRAGARGASDVGRGLAGQQQLLKVQEQQRAQQAMAQLLAQMRGQDADWQGANAQNWLDNNQRFLDYDTFLQEFGLKNALSREEMNAMLGQSILGEEMDQQAFTRELGGAAIGAAAGAAGAAAEAATNKKKPNYYEEGW